MFEFLKGLLEAILRYLRECENIKNNRSGISNLKDPDRDPIAIGLDGLMKSRGLTYNRDIRILGIRNNSKWKEFTMDDLMVMWDSSHTFSMAAWGTTTTGKPWMEKNTRKEKGWEPGALHIAENVMNKDLWTPGKHNGDRCLRQKNPLVFFRDLDENYAISRNEPLKKGNQGVHFHHMGNSEIIGRWSAGCQGCRDIVTHMEFLDAAVKNGQKLFSYAVISMDDVPIPMLIKLKEMADLRSKTAKKQAVNV